MDTTEVRPAWHMATLARYRSFMDALIVRFGGKCVSCGSTQKLEFDHIDWRTKKFAIATNWAMQDRSAFELELLKCQLLCSICHEAKTEADKKEMGYDGFTHGTIYAWMKVKCICDICGEAKSVWNKARNEARRKKEGEPSARGRYSKGPAEHGTARRYKQGCKCDGCRAANSRKVLESKALKAAANTI